MLVGSLISLSFCLFVCLFWGLFVFVFVCLFVGLVIFVFVCFLVCSLSGCLVVLPLDLGVTFSLYLYLLPLLLLRFCVSACASMVSQLVS